jgi:adenylosuccinate lyase
MIATYGTFAATERVMMELAKRGGSRQELHEVIREHALEAWARLRDSGENPLVESMCGDPRLIALASADEIEAWLDGGDYLGDAPDRARSMALVLRRLVDADL